MATATFRAITTLVAAQSLTSVKVELDELFEEFMDDEDNEDEHAVNEAFQVHLARTMDIFFVWTMRTRLKRAPKEGLLHLCKTPKSTYIQLGAGVDRMYDAVRLLLRLRDQDKARKPAYQAPPRSSPQSCPPPRPPAPAPAPAPRPPAPAPAPPAKIRAVGIFEAVKHGGLHVAHAVEIIAPQLSRYVFTWILSQLPFTNYVQLNSPLKLRDRD